MAKSEVSVFYWTFPLFTVVFFVSPVFLAYFDRIDVFDRYSDLDGHAFSIISYAFWPSAVRPSVLGVSNGLALAILCSTWGRVHG